MYTCMDLQTIPGSLGARPQKQLASLARDLQLWSFQQVAYLEVRRPRPSHGREAPGTTFGVEPLCCSARLAVVFDTLRAGNFSRHCRSKEHAPQATPACSGCSFMTHAPFGPGQPACGYSFLTFRNCRLGRHRTFQMPSDKVAVATFKPGHPAPIPFWRFETAVWARHQTFQMLPDRITMEHSKCLLTGWQWLPSSLKPSQPATFRTCRLLHPNASWQLSSSIKPGQPASGCSFLTFRNCLLPALGCSFLTFRNCCLGPGTFQMPSDRAPMATFQPQAKPACAWLFLSDLSKLLFGPSTEHSKCFLTGSQWLPSSLKPGQPALGCSFLTFRNCRLGHAPNMSKCFLTTFQMLPDRVAMATFQPGQPAPGCSFLTFRNCRLGKARNIPNASWQGRNGDFPASPLAVPSWRFETVVWARHRTFQMPSNRVAIATFQPQARPASWQGRNGYLPASSQASLLLAIVF